MDEIRIAIVGLGSQGAGTWLGLLQRLRGYRVVALCDPIEALHEPALAGVGAPRRSSCTATTRASWPIRRWTRWPSPCAAGSKGPSRRRP